ncbi:glutamate ABC transporter substrate-binding protein [Lentzea sp. BCCO 10_0798]|jgi:glutamate transport system substrate-binding protein|uniref:Glutamate ABC transporter substrate-binding protein n=1 Tax=Lentzea kristufekii TaxID=3095430 RepID=A0ABU4TQ35_9PSEU|nr:glutamate ABC transporter substrate-binding protein [Lentzea sp. BCCO 10_0798]MDX8050381.1 glutamate ABC transporter substrate-binding protein [Lentzea sp. BCCO 10_0798]
MTPRALLRLVATTCAAVLLLASCAGGGGSGMASKVSSSDRMVIAVSYDQPGMAVRRLDGSYRGFDVDVAKYIANELGVKEENITWKEAQPGNRETLLTSGEADMVVSTYSITDKRKQIVDFVGPYFVAGQDLLVRMNESRIEGPKSLNASLRLCSTAGSTSAEYVRDQFAKDVKMVEYAKFSDCVTALLAENVDAVTTDDVLLAGYAAQNPELLRVVGDPFSKEEYGVGLHRDDPSSKAKVQAALQKMIDTGAWRKSLEVNIGSSGYKIPDPPKLAP